MPSTLAAETRSHHAGIPTRIYKSDDESPEIQDAIAIAMTQSNLEFGDRQAASAVDELQKAIDQERDILMSHSSPRFAIFAINIWPTTSRKRQPKRKPFPSLR